MTWLLRMPEFSCGATGPGRGTQKPSGGTSSRWDGNGQNRYGVPQQNPDEQAQKKAGRLNALPSHDSIGVWMPLVI